MDPSQSAVHSFLLLAALASAVVVVAIPGPKKVPDRKYRAESLSNRLEKLEFQLGRLTDLLTEQTVARRRRRRRITIRFMLIAFAAFAMLFAWFGNVYHRSRRQSAAVDRLVGENAFVMYSLRESMLVSLMPGDPQQPPVWLVRLLGDDFFRAVTNVSTAAQSTTVRNKEEILSALTSLTQLQRLRLTNVSLTTADIVRLETLEELQSLDISRTGLDSGSMPWIRRTQLRWFNASHTKLSDRALYDLSRCGDLQQLFLERTAISDSGLKHLHSMSQLRYLNLKRCPVSATAVKQLSDALPGCMIEWEPLRFLADGKVDGRAAARGRVRYGRRMPDDPRLSRRPVAPLDAAPVRVVPSGRNWLLPTYDGYPGYNLDVF